MDPLHANIKEFSVEGYTHIECFCPPDHPAQANELASPNLDGLTLAQLSMRLQCAECGGPLQSVRPWRLADVLGKPQGRRG
jgi:hypothetical protein